MRHPKFWVRFFLVASILTAGIIFYFSAQKGADSLALSDEITLQIAELFRPDYRELPSRARHSYVSLLSALVRKNAHFCEFALLGFNLMGFFRFRNTAMAARGCRLRAWGVATLYAITDELHQLFINERAAMITDVLIDSAGSLVGTVAFAIALAILARLWRRRLS